LKRLLLKNKRNKTTEVILNEEIPENIIENIKFIDLFCGIGSFHYSFKKLGWDCVMSCDIDKAVKETYKSNYGILPLGDITEIEPKILPTMIFYVLDFLVSRLVNADNIKDLMINEEHYSLIL